MADNSFTFENMKKAVEAAFNEQERAREEKRKKAYEKKKRKERERSAWDDNTDDNTDELSDKEKEYEKRVNNTSNNILRQLNFSKDIFKDSYNKKYTELLAKFGGNNAQVLDEMNKDGWNNDNVLFVRFSQLGLTDLVTQFKKGFGISDKPDQYKNDKDDSDQLSGIKSFFKKLGMMLVPLGAIAISLMKSFDDIFNWEFDEFQGIKIFLGKLPLYFIRGIMKPITNFLDRIPGAVVGFIRSNIKEFPKLIPKFIPFLKYAASIAKIVSKFIKFIPIVGAVLSFWDAYKRYENGQWIRGTISVLEGILNIVGPFTGGIGTAFSIGLGLFNIFLDSQYGEEPISLRADSKGGGMMSNVLSQMGAWFSLHGRKIPIVSSVFFIYDAYNKFMSGDIMGGFLDLTAAIPGVGTIAWATYELLSYATGSDISFKDAATKTDWTSVFSSFSNYVRDKVFNHILPEDDDAWFGLSGKIKKLLGMPSKSNDDEFVKSVAGTSIKIEDAIAEYGSEINSKVSIYGKNINDKVNDLNNELDDKIRADDINASNIFDNYVKNIENTNKQIEKKLDMSNIKKNSQFVADKVSDVNIKNSQEVSTSIRDLNNNMKKTRKDEKKDVDEMKDIMSSASNRNINKLDEIGNLLRTVLKSTGSNIVTSNTTFNSGTSYYDTMARRLL